MIKIKPAATTFVADVPLTPFGADKSETVKIEYAYVPVSKAKEMGENRTVAELLHELIVGWDGIDAQYTPETLDELLDRNPAMAVEMISGFWQGLTASRVKN